MAVKYYRHSGFFIASNLEVPEWSAFETGGFSCPPDITIRWQASSPQNAPLPEPSLDADRYSFFIPEAGFFQVRRTGEITITAVPDSDMKKVRVFLLGTAWGALCHLRGVLVLHAAVVKIGDAAVAFCGESGAGKSSMAAKLTTRGCPLISDDLCRVDLRENQPPAVYCSGQRLKLWREALTALHFDDQGREQDHARMDKFHVPLSQSVLQDCSPLTALYLLAWGPLGLTRLTGVEALRRLIAAATYRGDLLEPVGQLGGHWTRFADLVKRVPVWELTRPRDWTQTENTLALVFAETSEESQNVQ